MNTLYQNIKIPALSGKKLIKDSNLFSWIDRDFVNYGADKPTGKTSAIKVEVKELTEDMTFQQMFNENQVLSQEQILYFVENNKDKLDNYTFFLLKSKENFFVADVGVYSDGRLCVAVYRFEYSFLWNADRRSRVVVPQLADTETLDNFTFTGNKNNLNGEIIEIKGQKYKLTKI